MWQVTRAAGGESEAFLGSTTTALLALLTARPRPLTLFVIIYTGWRIFTAKRSGTLRISFGSWVCFCFGLVLAFAFFVRHAIVGHKSLKVIVLLAYMPHKMGSISTQHTPLRFVSPRLASIRDTTLLTRPQISAPVEYVSVSKSSPISITRPNAWFLALKRWKVGKLVRWSVVGTPDTSWYRSVFRCLPACRWATLGVPCAEL